MITLVNNQGMRLTLIQEGAIIVSLEVPDADGRTADIVLGYDDAEEYRVNKPHFGAVVGRYANRIAGARFTLDGREYRLPRNNGANCLHGGPVGFDKAMWDLEGQFDSSVSLTHTSPDGDQGFPGKLEVRVRYSLTDRNELIVDYDATTDAPTVVNLTQHSYFNLGGHSSGSVMGHELLLEADSYTPVDEQLIPTGEIASVSGTRFDFRKLRPIADNAGYDHNFVLRADGGPLTLAAMVRDPRSGRTMIVRTTEPGVQLYTGNHLDSEPGKDGAQYDQHAGLCLETQHFPDSPNKPDFPSTELRPGEQFTSRTIFEFGVS